jgi:hypothetical protein
MNSLGSDIGWNSQEEERRRLVWKSQFDAFAKVEEHARETINNVGKERTAQFERLGLFNAAAIAALVSFLGSHPMTFKLHILLQVCFVLLTFGMVSAFSRNWVYQSYLFKSEQGNRAKYLRAEQTARVEYGSYARNPMDITTGKAISIVEMKKSIEASNEEIGKLIREMEWDEKKYQKMWIVFGKATHLLTALALVALAVLAVINF